MGKRVYRAITEKRWIVELTLLPGASVARVGQAEGVNANQLFRWRRAYLEGKLEGSGNGPSNETCCTGNKIVNYEVNLLSEIRVRKVCQTNHGCTRK